MESIACELDILKQFKANLVHFLDELIEQFPQEADFVLVRIFVKDQAEIQGLMNNFIKSVLPYKEQVIDRNDQFFLSDKFTLLNGIGNKRNHFSNIWKSNLLDADDRETMWKWFDLFMFLGDQYTSTKLN
jgi:hypothetical protein